MRYPLLHRDLLRLLFAAVAPLARLAGVAPGEATHHILFLAGRALTVLMALATLRFAFLTARECGSRGAGRLAAWSWLAVLPQVYYARTMNLDAPYLFWFALALLTFVRLRREPTVARGLAFGGATAAAILTKDQAFGLFLLPGLLLLVESVYRSRATARIDRSLPAAVAVALAAAVVSYRLLGGTGLLARHLDELLAHPGTFGFSAAGLGTPLGLLGLTGRHLLWSLGLPLTLLVGAAIAAGIGREWRRREGEEKTLTVLLLFPLSYLLATLLPLGYQYDRFLLPVLYVLVVTAAIAGDRWLGERSPRRLRAALTVAFLFAIPWGVARAVAIDIAMIRDRRLALERETRGAPRLAIFRYDVRPPQRFHRLRVEPGGTIARTRLDPYQVVVLPAADLGEPALSKLAAELRGGRCGFRPARPDLARPSVLRSFPGFPGVLSNLDEIDPPLLLFVREPPLAPCGTGS